ncbi:RagB/SusD family nutrient uptake outer membrane protein [Butyricimonas hominis]|uniref:RagB/SusD family nutrient uptake outer membrane protein n=1 Tax=Butyricimonas TaxID=574697 RepID=UPI003514FC28
MKSKLIILALLLGSMMLLGSCEDYLDETADKSGNAYIYHMEQLYGLTGQANLYLGGENSTASAARFQVGGFMQEQYLMGDGISVSPDFYSKGMPMYFLQMQCAYPLYCWNEFSLKNDNMVADMTWKRVWERVYTFNTVLENMDKVVQTTSAIRAQVEGEARFGRAFYHFLLLTQYCQWEEEAPGIGYREDTESTGIPERQTVAYTLEKIYEDLRLSEDALKRAGRTTFDFEFNTRPTVPTVQALRARIALYRGDYETALTNAENALTGNDELVNVAIDPNNVLTPAQPVVYCNEDGTPDMSTMRFISYPFTQMNLYNQSVVSFRELYLPCMSNDVTTWCVPVSESFYNLFTDKENDARWTHFYENNSPLMVCAGLLEYNEQGMATISWETQQWLKPWDLCSHWHFMSQFGASQIVGMTTAEMYLTKAECLARKGQTGDAAEVLKTLRRTRFTDQVAAENIGGTVQEVLDERSREMGPFWRFFEMKRLNGAENAGLEIRRQILSNPADPTSVTELVIPANDPRWALPFYATECELMGWEQNEGWK